MLETEQYKEIAEILAECENIISTLYNEGNYTADSYEKNIRPLHKRIGILKCRTLERSMVDEKKDWGVLHNHQPEKKIFTKKRTPKCCNCGRGSIPRKNVLCPNCIEE